MPGVAKLRLSSRMRQLKKCAGTVTKRRLTAKNKGFRNQMRCCSCDLRLSELNHGPNGSFFVRNDILGRSNVKVSRAEVLWLLFAKANDLTTRQTRQLAVGEFAMGSQVQTDWFCLVREDVAATRAAMSGQAVQADEALFRGKRKGNVGRLLAGKGFGPRRSHFGGRVCGPWVFEMVDMDTGELRMIRVRRRDTPTLCLEIRKHVSPGTTIVTDEWAAYRRIAALQDADGTPLVYVHLTGGAHTQNIEAAWRPAKSLLVRNTNGWCGPGTNMHRGHCTEGEPRRTGSSKRTWTGAGGGH
ncbi:hypothetical protein HPB47_022905 [Ixodes persulcatus]|uniref:Uncharacterized protein n=1 Tax=Ixodes persulcatus TaxID=34615 RepID=A0AC60Q8Y5_IXOPE|nr:hypothetical protein HPB47_022905 [Ixodes persulcatus]